MSLQKSVINLSEESQLEAAITASLLESKPQAANNLVFSDDSDTDYISLSPDKKTEPLHSHKSSNSGVRSVGKSSVHVEGVCSGGRTTESSNGMATGKTCKTRKRPSNGGDDGLSRKKMRADIDPVCVAIDNIELTQSLSEEEGFSGSSRAVNGRGKRGKGKGKAKGGKSSGKQVAVPGPVGGEDGSIVQGCSVEEMLAAGDIQKEEVSLILFRLPDGTRLQKSFLCNHPVRVSYVPFATVK